ncbi:hypothetical protein CFOL_v3_28853 [Cephalotus follicularis]|uniref:Uncharacterized protein n=1 Tax=Cephalotus follicularis TaxID=3775 RepID=A0A1Q3CYT7_CEPFO|nr:hypothetical protein CFOL_v3_28853 [Cephalotus follicularis]
MAHVSYTRVGRRTCHETKGFRLNSRRFSVQRLRARFLYLFRLLRTWRSSCGQALKSLKRGFCRNYSVKRNFCINNRSRRSISVMDVPTNNMGRAECDRLRSFGRSNSFYSDAIADCLEFIKRSSISADKK